jgi:hypothetical protein
MVFTVEMQYRVPETPRMVRAMDVLDRPFLGRRGRVNADLANDLNIKDWC